MSCPQHGIGFVEELDSETTVEELGSFGDVEELDSDAVVEEC